MRATGVLVACACLAGVSPVQAASLSISTIQGTADSPARGTITIDTVDDNFRTADRVRLAQAFRDLPRASWRTIWDPQVTVTWVFPGFQYARDTVVVAEIHYTTGPNVIVSAVENMTTRTGGAPTLTREFLNPAPGVLFDLLRSPKDGQGAWPVVQYNDNGWSSARYAAGNNFVPLDWSSNGYAWCTEFTRAVDQGEPHLWTIIVAHTYARWLSPGLNVMDWSRNSTALLVDLAGDNLNLRGGKAYFAVLVSYPDGTHARYHLRRELTIPPDGSWGNNGWYVPSGNSPDWELSFASNKVPLDEMPSGPDLHYIEAVEIIITDGLGAPTGQLKMRNLTVWQ